MVDIAYESYRNAELGVLGSILVDAEFCLNEIILEVTDGDFITQEYKTIWRIIKDLHGENKSVDPYTVKSRTHGEYTKLVEDIALITPTAANFGAYVAELKRHSKLYMAKEIAQDILNDTMLGASDISEIRQKSEQLLTVLEYSDARKTDYSSNEMTRGFLDTMDKPKVFLDWGMQELNNNLLCEPGDFVLIGATPSTGKTALTIQLMVKMARKGKRILYFSYETTQQKLMDRIISCQAHVPLENVKRRNLTEYQKGECVRAARAVYNLPFQVIEAGGMTIEDIRTKVVKYNADVIFIDYVQLIAHKNERLTEYQRITDISIGIQNLCQKYKVIAVGISQLSRLNGAKPTMSSFRSSGQLEQDASVAILFYRPEDVEEGEKDTKRIFEIAKNKDGKCGKLKMFFDGEYQTFTMQEEKYGY